MGRRSASVVPQGALAVDRVTEGVHHAAEELLARRHGDDPPGALHLLAFLDLGGGAQEHAANVVLLEVERDASDAALELEELVHDAVVEAVHAGDAVTNAEHGANALHATVLAELLDFLLEDRGHFGGSEIHGSFALAVREGGCRGGRLGVFVGCRREAAVGSAGEGG